MLTPALVNASALVSQGKSHGRAQGGQFGKHSPKCDHYHCLGHTIDNCWTLHDHPARTTNVSQVNPSEPSKTSAQQNASLVVYA